MGINVFLLACNSKENLEPKDASYFIDTTQKSSKTRHLENSNDTSSSVYKKPISTIGNSDVISTSKSKSTQKKYYLIIGSFKDIQNAKRFSSGFSSNSSNIEILNSEAELNRVAKKMFIDKHTALAALRKYWKENKDSTAWILTK